MRPIEFSVLRSRSDSGLPALQGNAYGFNFVTASNSFDQEFAEFLDSCSDVLEFARLGTGDRRPLPDSSWAADVESSGVLGSDSSGWVVVQQSEIGIVNWIVWTPGCIGETADEQESTIEEWCRHATDRTGRSWMSLSVDQAEFSSGHSTFRELAITLVANQMFRCRAAQPKAVSWEQIRAIRDDIGNRCYFVLKGRSS